MSYEPTASDKEELAEQAGVNLEGSIIVSEHMYIVVYDLDEDGEPIKVDSNGDDAGRYHNITELDWYTKAEKIQSINADTSKSQVEKANDITRELVPFLDIMGITIQGDEVLVEEKSVTIYLDVGEDERVLHQGLFWRRCQWINYSSL